VGAGLLAKGRLTVLASVAALILAGCASVVNGNPRLGNAADAKLDVRGDSASAFDTAVKNALSDVFDFWRATYPKVSGGHPLPPLKGGLYSVDGLQVADTQELGAASTEACAKRNPDFIIDNGAFCGLDDSIIWDRAPSHLFAKLAQRYGPLMVALIFAHEVGHAISHRLGFFGRATQTIELESQADCAAGSWVAWALHGNAAHFRDITPQKVDDALEGFLDGRDSTPGTPDDISHGNGFDRLSALADGIDKGATYCYSDGYFASRSFTERPFRTQAEYEGGDNTPLDNVLDTSSDNFIVKDLNRFWTSAAQLVHKTFTPVKIASAAHVPCASSGVQFGYCPDDNTVYFERSFASSVYNSLPAVGFDEDTGNVTLVGNQPADFALGVLFAIGWGMAVRHQLFDRDTTGKDALVAAICYTGAYAKDVNVDPETHKDKDLTLSPADLDEASSAMLDQVGRSQAFGDRDTTGLDRIQAFVKGYRGGLAAC
jgi:predicted metalloprotease